MKDVDRIAALLKDPAIEKQIAAAIVLGELKAKTPPVVEGLAKLLESQVPPVQRHALEALAKIGPKKVVQRIFPLLMTSSVEVRDAAVRTIATIGEEIVPTIKERLATAGP